MDKFDQANTLHKLLSNRRTPISRTDLESRLDLTRSSTTRLISFCRDLLHMPVEYSRDRGGYYYGEAERDCFELPGLWFNSSELIALMTSHRLLADVQPGILKPWIGPLQDRIEQLLEHKHAGSKEVFNRIRILPMANRIARLEDFQKAADALVSRKQLRIQYSGRGSEDLTERWISPQRLIYYRDNWMLDAWCHLRKDLRTFAIDRMHVAETGATARDIPDRQLDEHLTRSYGIFAGPVTNRAVIHFSAHVARWVADEQWHPEQESRHLEDGRWELVVPYGNPTELIQDILKYGPDAEVVAPALLRATLADKLSQTLRKYRKLKKV